MSLIPNPVSTLLEQVLLYQEERQRVISSNLANANTPGYRAFDLALRSSLDAQGELAVRARDPRHLVEDARLSRAGARLVRSDAQPRLDGNNVSLEDEFVKLMDNRMRYQALFELMDRWVGLNPIAREIR
jgi:flagellar basal-body rod protein FlgB